MSNLISDELRLAWEESPFPSIKITSYFPVYAELFSHLRGEKCTFIETGVLDGGSLFMWRKWLGEQARIIGVDLNPAALKWKDHGFEIYIGDQGDPKFWQDILPTIGEFDALLDDGGHQSFQQIVTVYEAIKHSKSKAVIVVEDTASSFIKDFSRHGRRTFLEYSKDATDLLHARSWGMYRGKFPNGINHEMADVYSRVYSVQFFNGIVAYKIDSLSSMVPEVVRNKPREKASDFRYEGKDWAFIKWPSLFGSEEVVVKGGMNFKSRFSQLKSNIKKLISSK